MKRKENKPINQIPVPVVGMFSPHPSKFKLSNKRTSFKKQELERFLINRNNSILRIMDKMKDWELSNSDEDILKKLYFKGWLLSR